MGGMFRTLRADEIDCRIGTINENGLSMLLYKDARCDMNILDECFGPFGWQRHHSRDNANCIVSIYDIQKNEWIEKEDVGTESNTEAAKGLASDSFKRACVNWGIGRELYTSPFIWIPKDKCNLTSYEGRDGKKKWLCNDHFRVAEIAYDPNGTITRLVICNDKRGVDVFTYPNRYFSEPQKEPVKSSEEVVCSKCGKPITDAKRKDGTIFPAKEYIEACVAEFGYPVCRKCLKSEKQGKAD